MTDHTDGPVILLSVLQIFTNFPPRLNLLVPHAKDFSTKFFRVRVRVMVRVRVKARIRGFGLKLGLGTSWTGTSVETNFVTRTSSELQKQTVAVGKM